MTNKEIPQIFVVDKKLKNRIDNEAKRLMISQASLCCMAIIKWLDKNER